MRAHQIMTRSVITITPDATILEAANTMLRYHVSGLPVVDSAGKLVGMAVGSDESLRLVSARALDDLIGRAGAGTDQ